MIIMDSTFSVFLDNLLRFGLEYFGRYYGMYRGLVTNNADDKNRGRIKLKVPAVFGDEELSNWALPAFRSAGIDQAKGSSTEGNQYGEFWPPEEGDGVLVVFENGDPNYPMYVGGWYARDELHGDFHIEGSGKNAKPPTRRGWITKAGHKIILEDKDGEQSILVSWTNGTDTSNLLINKDATAKLDVKGKHFIHLKEDEVEIKLSEGAALKINGKDAGAVTVLGNGSVKAAIADHLEALYVKLKAKFDAFDAHVHPTGVGPSGPPNPMLMVPPWDAKINSNKLTFPDG